MICGQCGPRFRVRNRAAPGPGPVSESREYSIFFKRIRLSEHLPLSLRKHFYFKNGHLSELRSNLKSIPFTRFVSFSSPLMSAATVAHRSSRRTSGTMYLEEKKNEPKLPINQSDFKFDQVLSTLLNGVKSNLFPLVPSD